MKLYRVFIVFVFCVTALFGCGGSSKYEAEIEYVKQSPETYGMVYDVLVKLEAGSTIKKMPPFSTILPTIMKDVKWSAGKDERGNILVNATGYMTYLGTYSEVHIQWVLKGDLKAGNARPYLNGMLIDGKNPGNATFDTMSVLMLYNKKIINGKQLAMLGLYMTFNHALLNY